MLVPRLALSLLSFEKLPSLFICVTGVLLAADDGDVEVFVARVVGQQQVVHHHVAPPLLSVERL